jgi:hypothetical protein
MHMHVHAQQGGEGWRAGWRIASSARRESPGRSLRDFTNGESILRVLKRLHGLPSQLAGPVSLISNIYLVVMANVC